MAKDPKKRQKTRARKIAKHKAKRGKRGSLLSALFSRSPSVNKMAEWPLLECLIASEWRDTMQITQIVIARRSGTGQVAMATFLVDLACLGVKNAMTKLFPSSRVYRREYRASVMESQPMERCDLDLAAKVIDEAIKYARSLGFEPHRDARDALKLLGDANPQNCTETVPVGGEEGKPFFVAGPYDNVERIMRILDRNVGRENYHFLFPMGGPDLFDDL